MYKFHNWMKKFRMLAPDGEGSGSASAETYTNPNTRYENFVLSNYLKDQLATRLNLLNYATVDDSLQASAGMTVKVNRYEATGSAEVVAEGEGNTGSITMAYTPYTYGVHTVQARFGYNDEDMMTDPFLVEGGIKNMTDALTNAVNAEVIAELMQAPDANKVTYATAPAFADFVDAISLLDIKDQASGAENPESGQLFALLNRKTRAAVQKALKDDLKYVEAFIRTGYIGTVAGVNLYLCDAVADDTIIIATREAVTYFRKKGVETEQERDANLRHNDLYGRLVGFAALTDSTKVALIVKASASSGSGTGSGT